MLASSVVALGAVGLLFCLCRACCSRRDEDDEDGQLLGDDNEKEEVHGDPEDQLDGLLMCRDTDLGLSYGKSTACVVPMPITTWEAGPRKKASKAKAKAKAKAESEKASLRVAATDPADDEDDLLTQWELEAARSGQ